MKRSKLKHYMDNSPGGPSVNAGMVETVLGDWVQFNEHRAEIQRLQKTLAVSVEHQLALANKFAALMAENERLKSQWQPMETAPMDGTEILIYSEISGINVMLFMDGRFREKVSFCSLRSPPTHWMPLPVPPNA